MNIKETLFLKNHVSLCLQLIFQSKQKTLQNKEIENTINNLQSLLTNKFNAKIRTFKFFLEKKR
jgi:phenylalanyl-tRNA synthetase beta subunit